MPNLTKMSSSRMAIAGGGGGGPPPGGGGGMNIPENKMFCVLKKTNEKGGDSHFKIIRYVQ